MNPWLSGMATFLDAFDWPMATAALGFYAFNQSLKTWRFSYYLGGQISVGQLMPIVWIHSFWNNILPYRSGELTYVYLLRQTRAVSDGQNLMSLLAARSFDTLALLILIGGVTLLIFPAQSRQLWALQLTGTLSFILATIAALLLLVLFNPQAVALCHNLQTRLPARGQPVMSKLAEAVAALQRLRNPVALGSFTVLSLIVWFTDILYVWCVFQAARLPLTPFQALFICAFPVLAALLPIQTPAGLGIFEGTVTGGLLLLGLPRGAALQGSVLLHAHILFSSSALFALAWLWRRWQRRL